MLSDYSTQSSDMPLAFISLFGVSYFQVQPILIKCIHSTLHNERYEKLLILRVIGKKVHICHFLEKTVYFFLPEKDKCFMLNVKMLNVHVAILNTGCPYLIRGIIMFNVYTGKFATCGVIVE